jgi:hypothetical protein
MLACFRLPIEVHLLGTLVHAAEGALVGQTRVRFD